MATKRTKIPEPVRLQVLIEAGYRCAVPTCRNILAIDLHHMEMVSATGSNDASNLLPLCPTCHALYHRGTISQDAIYAWKGMLVALNHAFDQHSIDCLLFLHKTEQSGLILSGDGVLTFMQLIANGLARFTPAIDASAIGFTDNFQVWLTEKGKLLVEAWKSGNRAAVELALAKSSENDSQLADDEELLSGER